MSNLTHEIDALLALRKLNEILPNHPINLGMAYVMETMLIKECRERQADFQKTYYGDRKLEYFKSLFTHVARYMPLNDLFFSENVEQILGDIVADIVRDSSAGNDYILEPVGEHKQLQKFLNQINLWGNGRCYNYAALALFHLLEGGVRPVDALWLNDPINDQSRMGHQIIVIGLQHDDDYKRLRQSDALVFDFWAGSIIPAREYFKKGSLFCGFDNSVVQCSRIKEGESNPFTCLNRVEPEEIKKWKNETATAMLKIIHERKNKGAPINEFKLDEAFSAQSRNECANISDFKFEERTSTIKSNLARLGLFNRAARKIQKKFRATLRAKPASQDILEDASGQTHQNTVS